MKEQLISLETAKLAAEKKFDSPCRFYYNGSGFLTSETYEVQLDHNNRIMFYQEFSAPTQSLLQKWLREVHKIHIRIDVQDTDWYFGLESIGDEFEYKSQCEPNFKSHEEALEEGLLEALKLIN